MTMTPDRISEFKAMALGGSVASFDVFDTLLHRTCSPETIILQTCRKIAAALYLEVSVVRSARDRAVSFLRGQTFAAGSDGEYRFEDLGDRFTLEVVKVTGIDQEIVRLEIGLALSNEIRLEHECVFPDDRMLETVRELSAAGLRVAAVSDMYHSRDTIVSLLQKIGAGDLFSRDNVFVSADYHATKASGKLYGIVLERLGVSPQEVVHIGDSHASDYVSAEDLGIRAVHYDATAHHDRYREDIASHEEGRRLGQAAHEAAMTALDESKLSHRIASAVAPVLCQFSLEVAERSKKLDVDSVWFMARDGYLPMKLYELFDDGTFPLPQYLYVSRKSVGKASSKAYGLREAFMAQWNGESRKLCTLLAPFEFDGDEAASIAARFGFLSVDEEIDYATDPRFHRLLEETAYQERFASDAAVKRASLVCHLQKSGFMSQRHVSVVDVGWAGQIQEALELAISSEQTRPHVTGLYMALRGLGGYRRLAGHDVEGLIYDCSQHDWMAASILNAVDVFEDTCRARHGTVMGYDDNGDPILAAHTISRLQEMEDEPRLKQLQDAIMIYATRWISYLRMFEVRSSATKSASVRAAARLTRFPSAEEANYFTSMSHGLDAGSTRLLERSAITGTRIIPRIKLLRAARWKEAAAADYVWGAALQFVFGLKRQLAPVGAVARPLRLEAFAREVSTRPRPSSACPEIGTGDAKPEDRDLGRMPRLSSWSFVLRLLGSASLRNRATEHLKD